MRWVLQKDRTGEVKVDDVPAPALRSGAALISVGTEQIKVETEPEPVGLPVFLLGSIGARLAEGIQLATEGRRRTQGDAKSRRRG